MIASEDWRWLEAADAIAERARPLSSPNPPVGAIIVKSGIVVGRGWTQPGGRPHAEAVALAQAGEAARGATLYVTLEPCAHTSERGRACTDLVIEAGIARVVPILPDPDPRTFFVGLKRMMAAGIEIADVPSPGAANLVGWGLAKVTGYPEVTLKLAVTADGFIARPDGTSKWITGEAARAHAHRERARADAILVGGGTLRADEPRLDVRLPGLEGRSPQRAVLTRGEAPEGWVAIKEPRDIKGRGWQHLLVEGGASVAEAFLAERLVHRLLLYRSPTEFGEGIPAFRNPGPNCVPAGWTLSDRRQLGNDFLEVYDPDDSEGA